MTLYTLLILWNLSSGGVFWVDNQECYHRGVFNWLGYLALLVELFQQQKNTVKA